MTPLPAMPSGRRLILGVLLGGLVILGYTVLQLFLAPLAWAAILAYTTWPLHVRLRRVAPGWPGVTALMMTLLLTAAFVLPLLWLMTLLRGELTAAYAALAAYLAQGPHPLPEIVTRIPWLGEWLQEAFNRLAGDPAAVRAQIALWGEERIDDLLNLLGGVGRNAAKFGFALLALFFLYRDGEGFVDQVRRALRRLIGRRVDDYLEAAGATTSAVVVGLVLTALAQGILAGLGYWVAGVKAPVLMAALTVLIALIPFGTPFVWGSIGIWLLLNGQTAAGIGLLLWGTLVVSWVDNLIRPMVISSATRIPFILVMFGVLGGLAAFGMVGLFIGPVILAILMAVWREWVDEPGVLEQQNPANGKPPA